LEKKSNNRFHDFFASLDGSNCHGVSGDVGAKSLVSLQAPSNAHPARAMRRNLAGGMQCISDRLRGHLPRLRTNLKPEEALSDARRNATNEWYLNTLYSRLNGKCRDAIVIIMQRLHEESISGARDRGRDGKANFNRDIARHRHPGRGTNGRSTLSHGLRSQFGKGSGALVAGCCQSCS
jgi:hypothetical protein